MPNDGVNFFIEDGELDLYKSKEPLSSQYIKSFLGAQEFLNGKYKYCLWLTKLNPKELDKMPFTLKRIKEVEKLRKNSLREATKKLALYPSLFGEIRQLVFHQKIEKLFQCIFSHPIILLAILVYQFPMQHFII
jgi:hypothetical protein